MPDVVQKLRNILGERLKENEPLSPFTTFKIGGPAKYFCLVQNTDELMRIMPIIEKSGWPFFILGGGSNILVSDNGFDGLVMKFDFNRIKNRGETLECEAGVFLSKAVGEALSLGLSGLEWAAGIYGTVGGAIFGNAGAYSKSISEVISEVSVWRQNKIKILKNKDCGFSYRESVFSREGNKDIILSATLKLMKGNREKIKKEVKEILAERTKKFDNYSCAGSVFKNIVLNNEEMNNFRNKFPEFPEKFMAYKKVPAGWLIEECGLKGKKIGGAQISQNHANIIVNAGGATAEDVVMLISIIKQKVRQKFNIQLMEEIRYVGF
ncbi:MAG: UDP-N-acetylmuramate dehydrogenase [Patescibacteria group bacterium]